jgi:Flp pilus assembly protein TadG
VRSSERESGAVAVEFALVATLLLMLVMGIVSFGLQFGARIVAEQAASEGARAAAAGLSASERQSLASAAANNLLNSYGGIASVNTVSVSDVGTPVTDVQVQVTVDISRYGLASLASLIPVGTNTPTATVVVQVGGF